MKSAFTAAVLPFKGHLTYEEADHLLREAFGVRSINGFRLQDGWQMPEPPRPGMKPVMVMHGTDGLSVFWWDPAESKYPPPFPKDTSHLFGDLEDPFVEHDTGSNYKACADAYHQLGFIVL
jgi:hypothetical protein